MALGYTQTRPLGQASTPAWRNPNPTTPANPNSFAGTVGNNSQGIPNSFAAQPQYNPQVQANQQYRSMINTIGSQYAPDQAMVERERARNEAAAAYKNANYYPQKEAGLRQDYALNMRGADLDLKGIGVDRGAANRDAAYYQNLLALMPQYRGLSKRELETALGEARRQGTMERLGINSDYTSRGAYFSGMRSLKQYNSMLGQGAAEARANTGYDRDMLGFTEKELGLNRSKAMTGDTLARLDIDAQRVGLSRDKYKAAMEQGLASLGYDKFMDLNQLMAMRDSTDAKQRAIAEQIAQQIYMNGQAITSGALGGAYQGFGG